MREEFYENSAVPQNERSQKVFYAIYQFFFVFSIIILVFSLYFYLALQDIGFLFIIAFALIIGVGCFFIKRRLLNCYDYTFVGGEIRIVQVISGKHRKLKFKFDSKNVYQVGKAGSDSYKKLSATPLIKIDVLTPNGLNAENQLFYIAAKINGENRLLVLECKEKFISLVVARRGSTVIEKDYK